MRAVAAKLPVKPYYTDGSKGVFLVQVKGYDSAVKLAPEGNQSQVHTLEDWQKFSGKDAHSIFADPKWIDPMTGRWDLAKDSPNIGAGENGATIGALGYLKEKSK